MESPTHTDLYLQWDSHHTISLKYSVVSTLYHRARTVLFQPSALAGRRRTSAQGSGKVQVPSMGSQQNKAQDQSSSPKQKQKRHQQFWKQHYKQRPHMVVPYTKGLSESVKKVCNRHGVQVYFGGGKAIRSFLVAPKDKDPILKKSEVIYRYRCDRVECDKEYIEESSRTFEERFKEHQKAPSPICDHSNTTGQTTNIEHFSIVGREDQNLIRILKEALYIRVNNPSLNRNIGNYHLPHIWDDILLNTSKL